MTSSDRPGQPVEFVVIVHSIDGTAAALISAVRTHHPDWMISAAWAGDPQIRPVAPSGTAWSGDAPAEIDLCRVTDDDRLWLAGLTAARSIIADRANPVIVAVAGAVAVAGPIAALVPTTSDGLVVIPRIVGRPSNGFPDVAELFTTGSVSSSAMGFGVNALEAIDWLLAGLRSGDAYAFGRRLDVARTLFMQRPCLDPAVGASVWRWPENQKASLVDAPNFDAGSPILLDRTVAGRPRVSVADADRLATVRRVADQLGGRGDAVSLPGGIPIDAVVRRLARNHTGDDLRPWSRAREFRDWLGARYWMALLEERPDLAARFGSATGFDGAAYRALTTGAAARGEAPLLIDPAAISNTMHQLDVTGCRHDGINVVGYLDRQSGVGAVGRAMVTSLAEAGIAHTAIAYQRTANPFLDDPPPCDQRIEFATTLACVNGDQMANLRSDHPELFGPGRRVIGYWFWELATIAGGPAVAVDTVQEIWSATRFMADAFAEHGVPVRHVPLPIAEPVRSDVARNSFAPLADADGRFVFGVVLDHLSVTARKNPLGAIAAFTQAFAADEGPLLIIKTINGEQRWREHEELLLAAAQRPDVVVWDAHLPIAEHFAFIGHLDALVSLHRSEGLGLHLAEAMWMNVPVIATAYSGNLDFMDDATALLVDADLVAVGADGGWAYPAEATWASPNTDHAGRLMRRLIDEPDLAGTISTAASSSMRTRYRRDSLELSAQLAALSQG
jgi:glycosyltransferase involved in cell wall biosynthesis